MSAHTPGPWHVETEAREAAIRAQLAEAKRRARTWQLGRVAS